MNRGIIDAHTHMFPEDVIKHWEKYAQQDAYFRHLTMPHPDNHTEQRYANAEEALALADEAGVETIVMQGWYWNDHGLCQYHNDYMKHVMDRYPGRFEAYAAINPTVGWPAIWELERCYEMGFAGVGELGPGGNAYSLCDKRFLQLMEAAAIYNMPVCIHCSEPLGHEYFGKDKTPLEGFYDVAKAFPALTLIIAHMGGGLPYYMMWPEVKEAFQNVYFDIAGNPLLYDIKSIRCVAALAGTEKLLFGSDFPLLLYPKRKMEMDFISFVEDIDQNAELSEEQWRAIMGDNMRALLQNAGKRAART